jgi:hypothetical protein
LGGAGRNVASSELFLCLSLWELFFDWLVRENGTTFVLVPHSLPWSAIRHSSHSRWNLAQWTLGQLLLNSSSAICLLNKLDRAFQQAFTKHPLSAQLQHQSWSAEPLGKHRAEAPIPLFPPDHQHFVDTAARDQEESTGAYGPNPTLNAQLTGSR